MSKNKEIIKILLDDITSLRSKVALLDTKVESLDDNLAFYASSINNLEMDVKKLSYDFHEEQYVDPQIFKVSKEAYDHLEAELNKPPKKNKNLSKLFNTDKDDYLKKLDTMILEKKIRDGIIAKLEEEAENNTCNCGDTCQAYDNGFQDAISTIKDM